MATDRTNVNETWLMEMPSGFGQTELYDMMLYNITDLIKHGNQLIDLQNNLKKFELETGVYYWYEVNGEFALGAELSKRPANSRVFRVLKKLLVSAK